MHRALVVVSLLLSVGCGSDPAIAPDAGVTPDSGAVDAATPLDAGTRDASSSDDAGAASDAMPDAPVAPTCDTGPIEALLDGLLYTSESDYPLQVVTHPDEGAAAPTPADVARLASASAAATIETDTEERFWAHVVVDPTRAPPIPEGNPVALRDAFESLTTDRIVVRIIEPTSAATVLVYLAGRTSCGALVWLSSASIET